MLFVKMLNEGPAKVWYQRSISNIGDCEFKRFTKQGYVLDENSGLLLRPHFSEAISQQLGRTIIDMVFPRPSDYHVHPEMGEAIKVLSGRGKLLAGPEPYKFTELSPKSETFIQPGTPHAFTPNPGSILELEVACTKIYDSTQEKTLKRFDHFNPWLEIWNR